MSRLEDRLMEIMELHASGLDDIAVAQRLDMGVDALKIYLNSTKKVIDKAIDEGAKNSREVAAKAGLSPVVLEFFISIYNVEIPEIIRRPYKKKEERMREIKEVISRGTKTRSEIAAEVGITQAYVGVLVKEMGIKLPKKIRRSRISTKGIEVVRESFNSGVESVDELIEKTGYTERAVRMYAKAAGIPLTYDQAVPLVSSSTEDFISMIRNFVDEGKFSVDEMAMKIGISKSYLCYLAKGGNISLPKLSKGKRGDAVRKGKAAVRKNKIRSLCEALVEGVKSLEELCRKTGIKNGGGVMKLCEEENIKLPSDLIPYRNRPEIDTLIDQGLTLGSIGAVVGLKGERIRQYINESGQYDYWMERKRVVKEPLRLEKEKKKELQNNFASAVSIRAKELAKEEGVAFEQAMNVYSSLKKAPDRIPFEKILRLFVEYDRAIKRSDKLSLNKLANYAGIHTMSAHKY